MGVSYDKTKKRWVMRIRRKDTGEIVRTLRNGITKSQAEEEHRRIERELIDKRHGKQRVLISEVWQRIIDEELPKHKRPENTIFRMRSVVRYVEGKYIDEIPDISRQIVKSGGAVGTRNRKVALLSRTVRLSHRWFGTPLVYVERAGKEKPRDVFYTREQVSSILVRVSESLGDDADHLSRAIKIAAFSGLRQGELLALRSDDITSGLIRVRESKTDKPRLVPIAKSISDDLKIFVTEEKKPRGWYSKQFYRFSRMIGAPGRFHDLRHTCASWLIQSGVDLYKVSKILGHTSIKTTERYAHLTIDDLRMAMERI